jgi:hypothetical protein
MGFAREKMAAASIVYIREKWHGVNFTSKDAISFNSKLNFYSRFEK